jgi:osmotically-inducible protein OsmY
MPTRNGPRPAGRGRSADLDRSERSNRSRKVDDYDGKVTLTGSMNWKAALRTTPKI